MPFFGGDTGRAPALRSSYLAVRCGRPRYLGNIEHIEHHDRVCVSVMSLDVPSSGTENKKIGQITE